MTHTRVYSVVNIPEIGEKLRDASPLGLFVLFGTVGHPMTGRQMLELDLVYEYFEKQIPWAFCEIEDPINASRLTDWTIQSHPTILWLLAGSAPGRRNMPDISGPCYCAAREVGTVFAKKIQSDVEKIIDEILPL
jgi:hypothetical protein